MSIRHREFAAAALLGVALGAFEPYGQRPAPVKRTRRKKDRTKNKIAAESRRRNRR
jgi:hypothetical protein